MSAPVVEYCAVGLPLPPSEYQLLSNPRHQDLFSNLLFKWVFDNNDIISMIRSMIDDSTSVKVDFIFAFTQRSLAVPNAEETHYDLNFRINQLRMALSDSIDRDPRQLKVGKAEIVIVDRKEEEGTAIKVTPYRLRTIYEALDDI